MIEERMDSKGRTKLAVRKLHNPDMGNHSGFLAEFSAAGWNQITVDYFDSIKNLSEARLTTIFDDARALVTKGKPHLAPIGQPEKSSRSTLQSDNESGGKSGLFL